MAKDDEKKESGEWKEFFWNPRTHELLGRTASSWGLILLFYLIFYTFLAGMFCLTMYVMLLTLDDYRPTWQDRLATPGTHTHSLTDTHTHTHTHTHTDSVCFSRRDDSAKRRSSRNRL
uniref:Sodium/potassium-transporting ATPase subunit beta-2 n=1 Tax=Sinocyclocheilus anshuiensis TaxID=1608454 RepID=A0A671M755_9TELE